MFHHESALLFDNFLCFFKREITNDCGVNAWMIVVAR